MKKQGNDNIQKFSLRKYKGIGAASVLLGMLYLGASPVLAVEDSTATSKEEAVSNPTDKIEMETLSNGAGSYTMPKLHVFKLYGDLLPEDNYTEERYAKKHVDWEERAYEELKKVESNEENVRQKGSDTFNDTRVSYVTDKNEVLKEEEDLKIKENNQDILSSTLNYKIKGLFGKRYEGTITHLNEDVLSKLKEEDKVIEKDGEKYHKIDTTVEKKEGTSKETTFNNVTVHANPENLHNEDGSIRYENIKDGSRVWLVSETSENHYDKYVLATKPTEANDTWVRDTFKNGEGQAKEFTKNNIDSDGGIKEGDTILVVEKNEVAIKGWVQSAEEQGAFTTGIVYDEASLKKNLERLLDLNLIDFRYEENPKLNEQISSVNNLNFQNKNKTFDELYKDRLKKYFVADNQKRPIYSNKQLFDDAFIRDNGGIKKYTDIEEYLSELKKRFGDGPIKTGWDSKRDKIEPKILGNIEEFKETSNYESEKAYLEKFKEEHKNIQYVDKAPIDANFVKNVFEVNVDLQLGDRDTDPEYPRMDPEDPTSERSDKSFLAYKLGFHPNMDNALSKYEKFQYGLGQFYKEYEKEGITYRVASITRDDFHIYMGIDDYTEIHYYNLYLPTRAYHISDKLTNIKNIYAKEETEVTENKGTVIVKYELADGTIIKESADVVKDAVVSSTETKYYLDKDNQKVIVGAPTTTNKEVSYDATTSELKLQEITKDGKKYKLVGLKAGSPAETGKVVSGTTEITYVYKLVSAGNVFEKYMLEGTNTEITIEKQLKNDASIGDSYTSTPPKAHTVIKKDGKSYIYKGHRSTSAPETGTVDETIKTVIYDFVELIAEKGEPDKQDNLPEGVISEKGKPEVQEELPEGVVTGKGASTIHEIDKLIVTRYIAKDEGIEIIPTEKGRFKPEQDFVDNNGRRYQYIETKEHDGIITHYYKQISTNGNIKVTETTKQEELKNTEKSINPNRLPNTGNNSTETIGLGVLSLLGAGIVRRKKENKDNI